MAKKKSFWGISLGNFANVGVEFEDLKMKVRDVGVKNKTKRKLRKNKSYRR